MSCFHVFSLSCRVLCKHDSSVSLTGWCRARYLLFLIFYFFYSTCSGRKLSGTNEERIQMKLISAHGCDMILDTGHVNWCTRLSWDWSHLRCSCQLEPVGARSMQFFFFGLTESYSFSDEQIVLLQRQLRPPACVPGHRAGAQLTPRPADQLNGIGMCVCAPSDRFKNQEKEHEVDENSNYASDRWSTLHDDRIFVVNYVAAWVIPITIHLSAAF